MDQNTKELFEELRETLNNYADINKHGGPNRAMVALEVLDELKERYEAELQAHKATGEAFDKMYREYGA